MLNADERYRALSQTPLVGTTQQGRSLVGTWKALRDVVRQREMLNLLVRRDLKARYKDSALGFVWTLIKPLTQLAIYYVVIGQFLGAERGIPDFAIYVFTGLTAYALFSEIVVGGTGSITGNSGLIKKVYLPREVFPLASVGSALFNFGIQLVVLVSATIILQRVPWSLDLLYALPAMLVLVIYGTAFGLLLAAVNVYLRDIQYLVEVLVLIMFWASPIVYSWQMVRGIIGDGLLLDLYTNNPVTLAVLGFQQAFWVSSEAVGLPSDLLVRLGFASLIGLVLLVLAQRIFARLQGNFAQEL